MASRTPRLIVFEQSGHSPHAEEREEWLAAARESLTQTVNR
jgi:pimeloyl-ACP methyl ester carboxylesterase